MSVQPRYGEVVDAPTCPRHPAVVSYVRCQRCNRPTCPECQRPASVGIQCVDCVREARKAAIATGPRTLTGAPVRQGSAVTKGILGVTVAAYVAQLLIPGLDSLGMFVPVFGLAQPWRFLTAALLHVGIWHLALNMYALYVIGPSLEAILGRARFLTLYVLSAIGGSVLVLLLANPADVSWFTPVVGASGAIFGLFGAMALTLRRLKARDSQLLLIIAINIVIGFVVPGISWQGHLGGLAVGAALAGVYLFAPAAKRRPTAIAISVVVALVLLGAVLLKYATV